MREFLSRTGNRFRTTPADFKTRNDLPYGKWICSDGREVLFNRFYEPIWQRRPQEKPAPADPHERVPWSAQEWFYDDTHGARQRTNRAKAALADWGIGP